MAEILTYVMVLIALVALAVLIYVVINQGAIRMIERRRNSPQQGVIKHDWLPTGRIDFAMRSGDLANAKDRARPSEFRLLVEERRIVESIAENENLEIQWRLATLREAKAVVTQYHKYLSENSLLKSIADNSTPSPALTVQGSPSDSDNSAESPPALSEVTTLPAPEKMEH